MQAAYCNVIILAAGSGQRFGDQEMPKQYQNVNNRPLLSHTIECFLPFDFPTLIVARPEDKDFIKETLYALKHKDKTPQVLFKNPENRQQSTFFALEYLQKKSTSAPFTIIHDGARPLVSSDFIHRGLQALKEGFPGVIGALPLGDSLVKEEPSGKFHHQKREGLYRLQTPEFFSNRHSLASTSMGTKPPPFRRRTPTSTKCQCFSHATFWERVLYCFGRTGKYETHF